MSGLSTRLLAMANDFYSVHGETMKIWDAIRARIIRGDRGDMPRVMFEQILENAADLMQEAAEELDKK